jgi:hypothetical protein
MIWSKIFVDANSVPVFVSKISRIMPSMFEIKQNLKFTEPKFGLVLCPLLCPQKIVKNYVNLITVRKEIFVCQNSHFLYF